MRNLIDFIKKIRSNTRTKAVADLIMYLLLFAIIFLVIRISAVPVEQVEKTSLEVFRDLDEYSVEIIDEDYNIIGICSDSCIYTYNDLTYTLIDSKYVDENLNELEYDFSIIEPSYIYNLIQDKEIYSSTRINSTNEYINKYKIDDYYISTYELDDLIYKVEFEYTDKNIEITYS